MKAPFKNLQYCIRCCQPETTEKYKFDKDGICRTCQSSEDKMSIDWSKKEKQLRKILLNAKKNAGNNYDCVLPISGGKDSFFQAHVLTKIYNIKPLAVTFNHNWFSEIGFYNLQLLLETFNLDHFQFTPARKLVNKLARKSLFEIGDSCWHCHSGCGSFPLQVATKFSIPLLVYGESIAENSGRAKYSDGKTNFDKNYFTTVSAKKTPKQMVDNNISNKDVFPFKLPTDKEINKNKIYQIHLGDYIFWDEEKQTEFIKKEYGWKESEIEGAYKGYKSVECIMPGVHDFTCYLKRGFGRSTSQASVDIRNGLLTREEGFEIANKKDPVRPVALDYYLEATELTEKEFYKTINSKKLSKLKKTKLPVYKNKSKINKVKPFVQTLIEKHKKKVE